MIWTTKAPEKTGLYWFRWRGEVTPVYLDDEGLISQLGSEVAVRVDDWTVGEWWDEPLTPPGAGI